jgi:hypothetical protein
MERDDLDRPYNGPGFYDSMATEIASSRINEDFSSKTKGESIV